MLSLAIQVEEADTSLATASSQAGVDGEKVSQRGSLSML